MTRVRMKSYLPALAFCVFSLGLQAEEFKGSVTWANRTTLGSVLQAEVEVIPVRAGDRVEQGELLLKLENSVFKARVDEAKAVETFTEKKMNEAKSELKRSEELYDRTLLSDHDLSIARLEFYQSRSDYLSATAKLIEARNNLRATEIKAPFAAQVLQRWVNAGESINGSQQVQALLDLASSQHRLLRLTLSQTVPLALSLGRKVRVEVDGRNYDGEVSAISWRDENVAQVDVSFLLRKDEVLAVGKPGRVILP